MEHATKMVLVSPDALSVVKDRPISSATTNLTKLDRELKQILDRRDMLPFDKVQLYNQILQRYLSYYNQAAKKPITVKISQDTPIDFEDVDAGPAEPPQIDHESLEGAVGRLDPMDKETNKLLMNFPVTLKAKARSLLDMVKDSDGTMNYNKNGELIADGMIVPGSHISDLLYDILLGRRGFEPRGSEQFLRGLIKMNVPERIVANTSRRYKMMKMKQQGLTSPGTPESIHDISSTSNKAKKKKSTSSKTSPLRKVKGHLNWETYSPT